MPTEYVQSTRVVAIDLFSRLCNPSYFVGPKPLEHDSCFSILGICPAIVVVHEDDNDRIKDASGFTYQIFHATQILHR